MSPLERLFTLEIEFHRKLRCEAPGTADPSALHTSYALQAGYELLLRGVGRVTAQDIARLTDRLLVAGDARDVLAARDSLIRLLDVRPFEP
jgi:hypothetical protein